MISLNLGEGEAAMVPAPPEGVDTVKWLNGMAWAFQPWSGLGEEQKAERYQALLDGARKVHADVKAGTLPTSNANGWIMGWGQRNRGLAEGAS